MMFQSGNDGLREREENYGNRPQLSIGDVVLRVWRARYWTIAGAVLFGLLCLLVMPFIKPVYEASAQVYIDPQNLQLLQHDLTPTVSGGDAGVLVAESQVRIMQSASVLRLVVKKLDLTKDPEFGGGGAGHSLLSLPFGGGAKVPTDPVEQAVESLSRNINVVREDRTYMVTVYARSHSAERSAQISNAIVDAYLELRDDQRTDMANNASDSLEDRLGALQATLKTKEDAVAKFKVDHNIVEANGNGLAETRLSQNNSVVSAAEDAMNKRKVERDQLRDLLSHPERFLSSPLATASPDLLRLRGDLEASQAALSTLQATLGPRHPQVVTAATRVAAVQRLITAEITRLSQNADIAYESARSDYQAASKSLDPLVSQVQKIDSARIQLRQLQREADSARAIYEEAFTRSRETREQGGLNTLNAQIVSRASAPIRRKSPPSTSVMLVLAVAFGGALGLASGVGYDAMRDRSSARAPLRETQSEMRREARRAAQVETDTEAMAEAQHNLERRPPPAPDEPRPRPLLDLADRQLRRAPRTYTERF